MTRTGPTVAVALAVALGLVAVPAGAQIPIPLTLEDARARAVAKVPDVSVRRDDVRLAIEAERRAAAAFDSVVRVDSRFRSRTEPLNTLFSGALEGALGPRTTGLTAAASWSKLLTTGGTVTGQVSASTDRIDNLFATLTPAYQAAAGIEVRQPLAQGRRTDAARQRLLLTSADTTRTRAQLSQAVSEVVASVERAFWSLAAARGEVEVRERALSLARAQRLDIETRIEAGVAAEADLTTSDAAITSRRMAVIAATESVERADLALKSLIAGDAYDPVWAAPLDLQDTPPPPFPSTPVDALIAEALDARPEFADLDAHDRRIALEAELAADRLRTQVDLVGGYTLRGLAGRENPNIFVPFSGGTIQIPDDLQGGWGQTWQNTFGHRFLDASVGIAIALPLGNRAASADAAAASIAADQSRTRRRAVALKVGHEVRLAVARLDASRARRAAADDARAAAAQQLAAEEDRDAGGISSAFLLLTRQGELADAESALLTARADEAHAATELERATGRLLASRRIELPAEPSR